MGSLFDSGSGSKGGTSGFGLSDIDLSLLEQAHGLGTEAIHNRYQQLGIGVPQASGQGSEQTRTYGGASTMEQMDVFGLGSVAAAALGQLQNQNQSNPAIPGSIANQGQNINQAGQLTQQLGFDENVGGGINQTPNVSSGSSGSSGV